MLQRVVAANRPVIVEVVAQARQPIKLPRSSNETIARDAARARRQQRHKQARKVFAQVGTINGTAKKLGISRWLVRESLKAGTPTHRQFNKRIPSILDSFETHLFSRWLQGCRSAKTLWLELRAKGFSGSLKCVERWARRQRLATEAAPKQPMVKRPEQGFNVRALSFLLIREGSDLNEEESVLVNKLEQGCADLAVVRGLVLRFARGLRERKPDVLEPWLVEAKTSKIKLMQDFVLGLEREFLAIKAAFSLPWSKRSRPSGAFWDQERTNRRRGE